MRNADFYMAQNDTGPVLEAVLTDEDGTVIDLTGLADTDIRFHMANPDAAAPKVDDNTNTSIVAPPTDGKVQYDWQAADTDEPGFFDAEFQATFTDGSIVSFPNYKYFTVLIREEIA